MTQRPDEAPPADLWSSGLVAAQLTLNLGYRPALGRDSFLVTSANEAAVGWIDAWPNWPSFALVLSGPSCCGKTHLASVWQTRSAAAHIEGTTLDSQRVPQILAANKSIVIESTDRAPEEPLLHLLNGLAEQKNHALLVALSSPNRWPTALRDLSSRLRALPVAAIAPPDDMLLQAMLMKRFSDRGLSVGAEIVAYLAGRIERSFAAAERAVATIDRAALAEHRAVTLPLVRDILRAMPPADRQYPVQDPH